MKQKILLVVCILSGIFFSVKIAQRQPFNPNQTMPTHAPVLAPMALESDLERGEEGDLDERNDWFYFQRAYPFDRIPDEARRKAFAAVYGKGKIQTQAVPQALSAWTSVGPAPTKSGYMSNWGFTSGRINAIAVSPANSRLILLGSATGGIFRSTDGGNNFAPVTDSQVDLAVGTLAFSKSNPQIVYAGMGDPKSGYLGSGILKSTDAGLTWTRVNNATLPSPGNDAKLEIDPTNPNKLYLAQYARLLETRRVSSGFFTSSDGGVNWSQKIVGLPRDVVLDVNNPNNVTVGMARVDAPPNTPAGVYRSTDGGDTFTIIFTSPYDNLLTRDMRLAVTPADPLRLYLYTGGSSSGVSDVRVYVSTDSGQSWTNRGGGTTIDPNQFGYNTYIYADPTNADMVYVGSRDIFKSTDGGASFTNKTKNFVGSGSRWSYAPGGSNAHPDQHGFALMPDNPNQLYVTNDGGFYTSTNGGDSFTSRNSSLNLTMFVSLAVHPFNAAIAYGGTQDNGTQRRLANSSQWEEFATGDGGKVVINPRDPSNVFTTYVRGTIFRFFDDSATYDRQIASNGTFLEPESSAARIAFYAPFTGNGADSTLYFGSYRLFISTDLGTSWNLATGTLDLTKGITQSGADLLTAIGVGPANVNVIYTGSRQGRVMNSTDGGKNWTDITSGLPDRSVTNIRVDPEDSAIAYITFSGFNTSHIFKTINGGANWSNISGNLPDIPANDLLLDPFTPTTLYAATDIGVFISSDSGTTWQSFNNGLPPVIVTSFAAQKSGLITIGTYGRGAYSLNLGADRPFIGTVDFNGVKLLNIFGGNFGATPKVFINGTEKTDYVRSVSETKIKMKGKANALGLTTGDNIIRIVNGDGVNSNTFTYRL
ncbi:MAG: hypothetical protein HY231_19370 [Acidobacteria bacterium]|nr:hypothetical protein [Acidobacteriota bacterium]